MHWAAAVAADSSIFHFSRWVLSFKTGSVVGFSRKAMFGTFELLYWRRGNEEDRGLLVCDAVGASWARWLLRGRSMDMCFFGLLPQILFSLFSTTVWNPKGKQNTCPPDKLLKKGKHVCKSHFQPKRKLLDAKEQEKGDFIGILHPSMIGGPLSASCRPATPTFFMNWNSLVVPRQGIFYRKLPSPYLR